MFGRRRLDSLDLATIVVTLLMAAVGVYAIASATMDEARLQGLWRVQLVWLAIGLVAASIVVLVDYHVWAQLALFLHAGALALLGAVLFVGREVGGNRSWLVLGPARLQPSELAKWTTCLVLAVYLARRVRGSLGLRQLIELGTLVGLPLALIAGQPDMGTALIFVPILITALLLGGVRWRLLLGLSLVGIALAFPAWTQLKDYQKERIRTVFDPNRDPSGYGYQARQSKIAIGSGGLTGKGLFRGTQGQLNFLPAQHTDFVLAVVAEELGFFGSSAVLGLFYYLLYRCLVAARSSQDRLGTYMCLMVVAWVAGQLTINVGMVLGRLPTIGVPLPLMSYGGSSLVAMLCGIGLVVNVRSRRFVN
ncbi:MAG TPA: rod shape-determining protein RodA [Candidatus Polarisedimenticolaceae bacterium]|nr:rod shape-determining protein RodA [Candidatus Polarisedimenticolaceae bacterium]